MAEEERSRKLRERMATLNIDGAADGAGGGGASGNAGGGIRDAMRMSDLDRLQEEQQLQDKKQLRLSMEDIEE